MDSKACHRAIYLTGPTAAGKTAVGVAFAKLLDAEIIALDSMTLYRGMDIGTAKPTIEEREGVPHHLIDVLEPWETANVARYRAWALQKILDIEAKGKRVLFVGGTALYLKALLRGLFRGPDADPDLRRELEAVAEKEGEAVLHAQLQRLDSAAARRLHPNDRKRVIRALEIIKKSGQSLTSLQKEHDQPARNVKVHALSRPRESLNQRINHRVVTMFETGLVEEVQKLIQGLQPLSSVAAQAVGYREVIEVLEGRSSLPDAIRLTQTRTRQFAKRQATWFRGLAEVQDWPVSEDEPAKTTAERLAAQIGRGN